MSEVGSKMISRRRTLALLGLGAVFGLAGESLVTASQAEAQTPGMQRREGRRNARQVRRAGRRAARTVRSQARHQ
jgi:hypothetical protein